MWAFWNLLLRKQHLLNYLFTTLRVQRPNFSLVTFPDSFFLFFFVAYFEILIKYLLPIKCGYSEQLRCFYLSVTFCWPCWINHWHPIQYHPRITISHSFLVVCFSFAFYVIQISNWNHFESACMHLQIEFLHGEDGDTIC